MLAALYGPRAVILNVLASMSSLIFQLPVMLILFEYRAQRLGTTKYEDPVAAAALGPARDVEAQPPQSPSVPASTEATNIPSTQQLGDGVGEEPATESTGGVSIPEQRSESYRAAMEGSARVSPRHKMRSVLAAVGRRMLRNPPLIGIVGGLFFSLIVRMAADEDNFDEIIDVPLSSFGGAGSLARKMLKVCSDNASLVSFFSFLHWQVRAHPFGLGPLSCCLGCYLLRPRASHPCSC